VYRVSPTSMSTNVERMRESRRMVLEKHGIVAEAADDRAYEDFLVRQLVRGGHRVEAASAFLGMAVGFRDPTLVPKALLALAVPKVLDRVGERRAVARIPASWIDEVQGWGRAFDGRGTSAPALSAP
jgi:hypothetical protein